MTGVPFWPAVHGSCQRNAARFLFTRPLEINSAQPIISFTFDDFPRSALHTGGAILEQFNARGTYYASFGLMGRIAPTGRIFHTEDIGELLAKGHELGCHTFHHCHSWNTPSGDFADSIVANQHVLQQLWPAASFETLSYPISPPRPFTKRAVGRTFVCARGGGQTFNAGTTDLNYLRAYFLEKARGDRQAVEQLIAANGAAGGWLILATHDVADDPTSFGCRPQFFESIVRYAVNSGARVLPVAEAVRHLANSAARQP